VNERAGVMVVWEGNFKRRRRRRRSRSGHRLSSIRLYELGVCGFSRRNRLREGRDARA